MGIGREGSGAAVFVDAVDFALLATHGLIIIVVKSSRLNKNIQLALRKCWLLQSPPKKGWVVDIRSVCGRN